MTLARTSRTIAALMLAALASPAMAQQEQEPNNTKPTANLVSPGFSVTAGTLTGAADLDWFTFTLTQPSAIRIECMAAGDDNCLNTDLLIAVFNAASTDPIMTIVGLMKQHGVSQVPTVDAKGHPVGMVHEMDILRALQAGTVKTNDPAKAVSHHLGGLIYPKARIEELYRIFETNQVAIVVDQEKIVGIISQIDVIEFMGKRSR